MTRKSKYNDRLDSLSQGELGYICGILATDGNLSRLPKKYISLELQSTDKDYLLELAELLSNPPLNVFTRVSRSYSNYGRSYSKFAATLPKLYQYCLDMGITPAKSLTLDVKLEDKTDEFKLYFLRGVIDGDGSVRVGADIGESNIQISTASRCFKNTLCELMGPKAIVTEYDRPNRNLLWKITLSGHAVRKLAAILPKTHYMLGRKTKKLIALLGHRPVILSKANKETENLIETYNRSLRSIDFNKEEIEFVPRVIRINTADIYVDTLNVVEDEKVFYLTVTASKPNKPDHKVVVALCHSYYKDVLEFFKQRVLEDPSLLLKDEEFKSFPIPEVVKEDNNVVQN